MPGSQSDTLKRAYNLLKKHGTKINRSRMDAGSYSKEIADTVVYIRANKSTTLTERIREITEWTAAKINIKKYQLASLPFTQFFADRNYRLVVMREKNEDGQTDLLTGDAFKYRCILTGDRTGPEREVTEYCNQHRFSCRFTDLK